MDKKVVNILLAIVVLILIAINILIYINNHKEKIDNTVKSENTIKNAVEISEESTQNVIESKVSTMTEKERMQTYFGTFITYIEEKKYELAYELLNENFKQNYFDTIEKFEEYVQKYPQNMIIEYQDIDRQGELFVLTVSIKDVFSNASEPINQRVVIRENGTNDFKISFQVE